jgi:hypothetical protein
VFLLTAVHMSMHDFDHYINIFGYVLLKIMKVLYFESIHRNKSNILYINIYLYILVIKYDQSRLYE